MTVQTRAQRRRGRGVAVAASLLFHIVLLAAIGLHTPVLDFRPQQNGPVVEFSLVPAPEEPLTPRPPAPIAAPPTLRLHQPPQRPLPLPAPPLAPPLPPNLATPLTPAPTPPAPGSTAADTLHFYEQHVQGCGREDLILMAPEEQLACRARIAAAAAADRRNMRAEDRNRAPFMAIDPAKRAEYERAIERGRRRREAPITNPVQACTGVGSNLGAGCINPDAKPNF